MDIEQTIIALDIHDVDDLQVSSTTLVEIKTLSKLVTLGVDVGYVFTGIKKTSSLDEWIAAFTNTHRNILELLIAEIEKDIEQKALVQELVARVLKHPKGKSG